MMTILLTLSLLSIASFGQEPASEPERCFDAPTNDKIDQCLRSLLAEEEKRLAQAVAALKKKLSSDERNAFNRSHDAWKKYRDLHCRMAGLVFKNGRMEPLTQGACRVRLTGERSIDLNDIDVKERLDSAQ
jgi:uncharacterized protein YecT (DUF1311 family)